MKTNQNKKKNILIDFINKRSVRVVTGIPIVVAVFLVSGWVIAVQNNFVDSGTAWSSTILFISTFFIGLTGFVYIYKKEMPGLISSQTIKGGWAVFSGILLVVFFWGIALFALFLSVIEQ